MSQRGFLVVVLGFAHAGSACGSSVEPNEEPAAGASVTAGSGGAGHEAGAAGETAAAGAGQGGTSGNVNAAGSSSEPAGNAGQTGNQAGNGGQAGAPTWDQFLEQDYCRRACTEEMALPCYTGKTTLVGCQDDCVQRWLGLYVRCPDEVVALTRCAGEPAGFAHTCVEGTVVETYSLSCGDQVTALSTCGAGM
jgi:hypothetical protein